MSLLVFASAASRAALSSCGRARGVCAESRRRTARRVLRHFCHRRQSLIQRLFCGADDDDRALRCGGASAPGARSVSSKSASPAATPLAPEALATSAAKARFADAAPARWRARARPPIFEARNDRVAAASATQKAGTTRKRCITSTTATPAARITRAPCSLEELAPTRTRPCRAGPRRARIWAHRGGRSDRDMPPRAVPRDPAVGPQRARAGQSGAARRAPASRRKFNLPKRAGWPRRERWQTKASTRKRTCRAAYRGGRRAQGGRRARPRVGALGKALDGRRSSKVELARLPARRGRGLGPPPRLCAAPTAMHT